MCYLTGLDIEYENYYNCSLENPGHGEDDGSAVDSLRRGWRNHHACKRSFSGVQFSRDSKLNRGNYYVLVDWASN